MEKTVRNKHRTLAEELAAASDALLYFHSRTARPENTFVVDSAKLKMPNKFYAFGEPRRTNYVSDKDDPATRLPSIREKDPNGVQGIKKKFTHRHDDHVGLKIYKPDMDGIPMQHHSAMVAEVQWPSTIVYLGDLYGLDIDIFRPNNLSSNFKTSSIKDLKLYAFPDTRTLVAVKITKKKIEVPYLWNGGNLHVTWEGITG